MIDDIVHKEPTCALVDTDNYGGDYPNEKFVCLFYCSRAFAESMADAINNKLCHHRYYKVVDLGYKLQPGFEP